MKSCFLRCLLVLTVVQFAGGALRLLGAEEPEPTRTQILSETLEMQGTEDRNFFYFRGDVHVTGTNLEIRCDELTVTAFRGGEEDETVGEIGAIEGIVAKGNVEITQAGRRATAGRVEVDPVAGTVSLLENPRMIDGEVEVEGYKFVFYKDDRRVEVVPDPNPDKPRRSRVSLGALPANAFEQEEEAVTVTDRLKTESSTEEEPAEEETSSEETDGNE